METRNSNIPIAKRTPPAENHTDSARLPYKPNPLVDNEPHTASPEPVTVADSKSLESTAEVGQGQNDEAMIMPVENVVPLKKRLVKRVNDANNFLEKCNTSADTMARGFLMPKMEESVKAEVEEGMEEEVVGSQEKVETPVTESVLCAQTPITVKTEEDDVVESKDIENVAKSEKDIEIIANMEEAGAVSITRDQSSVGVVNESVTKEQSAMGLDLLLIKPLQLEKLEKKADEAVKETLKDTVNETGHDNMECEIKTIDKDIVVRDEHQQEYTRATEDEYDEEGFEEYADLVDYGEDDLLGDELEDLSEEAEALEEEQREWTAVAKERKLKKEYEIFVGGLDRYATEADLRNVFEKIGEVVEVRLQKDRFMKKNKGFAFVKFARKEHARRAVSEMKHPVIRGKRCGTAPSEDNDTLFLGNICNTWTTEAIRQKLKDYGVEGIENITLVLDVQHEGRSRGFAFVDFSCHADAMLAYKRLQKPDVIFGHPERTLKVAFAEPIREADPEVMAQVKKVFLDGLPPHWDENRVRGQLRCYGEVVQIVLARNLSNVKRRDFGFVEFSTRESAVACVEGINNTELINGNRKTRIKARLSNPLPKTQAVKGRISGGYRIDFAGSGTFQKFARGFERGGHSRNSSNFLCGRRGYYQSGHGQTSGVVKPGGATTFCGRKFLGRGGKRDPPSGGFHPDDRYIEPTHSSRSSFNGYRRDSFEREREVRVPLRRRPFSSEEAFDRPFTRRHNDDPYYYENSGHGMKRPFYMTDIDPGYTEYNRSTRRSGYDVPETSFYGTRYHDSYEARGDPYSHDYYDPHYDAYPSAYGCARTHADRYRY